MRKYHNMTTGGRESLAPDRLHNGGTAYERRTYERRTRRRRRAESDCERDNRCERWSNGAITLSSSNCIRTKYCQQYCRIRRTCKRHKGRRSLFIANAFLRRKTTYHKPFCWTTDEYAVPRPWLKGAAA